MTQPAGALLLLLAAGWTAVAVAATLAGVRRAAAAARVAGDAGLIDRLLAAAPVAPLLVYPNGSVDCDPRAVDWLGLDAVPHRFDDLGRGLAGDGLARLERAVLATLDTGRPIEERLALVGTEATLLARGAPYAAPGLPDRAVLLWLTDVSEHEREIARLRRDAAALARSRDGLAQVIEAAPLPIWQRGDGDELRLALVNDAYVRAVEAEDGAQVVARGLELVEAGTDGTAREHARATRERGVASTRNAPAILAGQRRVMRVVDVPLATGDVAGFAIDVQELEDARADLARLTRVQRDMLDRLSTGVAQFGADQALIFYNQHFLRMFALEAGWLADHPEFADVLDRMREAQSAPESRDFRAWREERRAWFQSAEPVEETWVLPGGVHLRVVAQPMPDGGVLLILEDRTEHLQLTSARDTLLRVRTATFDNLFEAVGVFAQDGRLQLWNNRFGEVWRMSDDELALRPRVDAFVEQVAPQFADPERARAIRDHVRVATLDRRQGEGRIALSDGRHYRFAAVPLPDGNALLTLVDITASRGIEDALRDRNAALEEVDRFRTDFVARMSHDLRDPLNAVTGFAEMLVNGYAGALPAVATDYAATIATAAEKLRTLIGDSLDLSQTEIGTLPLVSERIDLAELAHEAARLAEDAATAAHVALTTRIEPSVGLVMGDHRRLAQCLDHLLRNAIAYTPTGGRVLVAASGTEAEVELIVADTGPGMTRDQHARIFDRIARDRALSEDGRRGVGLPLARQLVEAHGGTLTLDSLPGRGTRAIVRLPRRPAA